jgi:hypothetical protein
LLHAIRASRIKRVGLLATSVSKGMQTAIATPCVRNMLHSVMQNDPSCRILDLGLFSGISDNHLYEVALALEGNTHLRVIKLGFNEQLTDCGLQTILVALRRSNVERVVAPLKASEAMRVQLNRACKANRARNAASENDESARQSKTNESPLARWRRAGAVALACSVPSAEVEQAEEGSAGEVAAEARLLEVSLLADAAAAEAAQRELGRRIALRVGKRDVKAMRTSDAMRRQIQAEVLAENRARLATENSVTIMEPSYSVPLGDHAHSSRRSREATESVVNHLLNQLIDEVERENPTMDEDNWGPQTIDPVAARSVAMRVSARQNAATALTAFIHRG